MNLKELYQQVQLKKSIDAKLTELYSQKRITDEKTKELKRLLQKEQDDVERLKNNTLSSFLYEIIGKKEEKLEKEIQEAHQAKAKYYNELFQLEAIEKDITRYRNQLKELDGCEEAYQKLLNDVLFKMKENNAELINLEEKLIESRSDQREIQEAKNAGQTALSKAHSAKRSLEDAGGWSTYDVIGGGLIADMAKYSHLDKAEQQIKQLQNLLREFKTELTDVEIEVNVQITVDGFLQMADLFFDNIFTDFTVRNKISNSINQLERVIQQIEFVLRKLDELMIIEAAKEKELKSKIEQYAMEHQEKVS